MDQSPTTANTMRQQGRIFIFRRHDHAVALKAMEIFRERQSDTRALTCVGGVDHGILAQFGKIGDARVFYSPHFFREVLGISQQGRLGIYLPIVLAIGGPGRA